MELQPSANLPSTGSHPPHEPRRRRGEGPVSKFIWSLVAIGLTLALILIAGITVLGLLPGAQAAFESTLERPSGAPTIALGITLLIALLGPVVGVVVAKRNGWLTHPVLALGWVAVLPILWWLTWDEPAIRAPLPIEEFSPAFTGAEKSFAVLMQYSKLHPSEEAKAFADLQLQAAAPPINNTRDTAEWLQYVRQERTRLEADWVTLLPQRQWLDQVAAFDRLGDLTPSDLKADMMSFQVWRILAQRGCAIATLRALDQRGDEAMEILLPLIKTGRLLQPTARTLVRAMIGLVVERMALETTAIVLDHAPVAPSQQRRLASLIADDRTATLARRLVLIEYAQFAPTFATMRFGDQLYTAHGAEGGMLRGPLNFLSRLLLLPNATTNLYGQRVYALASLAEKRALGEFAVASKGFDDSLRRQVGLRNVGGRLMLNLAIPAYDKILDNHWKTADVREALRRRLANPTAPR
jgi:hypothetical protein